MSNQYGNMGNVYGIRGDLDKAEEYWMKSLQLYEEIGAKNEIRKLQKQLADLKK
jgi:hypothetical protein